MAYVAILAIGELQQRTMFPLIIGRELHTPAAEADGAPGVMIAGDVQDQAAEAWSGQTLAAATLQYGIMLAVAGELLLQNVGGDHVTVGAAYLSQAHRLGQIQVVEDHELELQGQCRQGGGVGRGAGSATWLSRGLGVCVASGDAPYAGSQLMMTPVGLLLRNLVGVPKQHHLANGRSGRSAASALLSPQRAAKRWAATVSV